MLFAALQVPSSSGSVKTSCIPRLLGHSKLQENPISTGLILTDQPAGLPATTPDKNRTKNLQEEGQRRRRAKLQSLSPSISGRQSLFRRLGQLHQRRNSIRNSFAGQHGFMLAQQLSPAKTETWDESKQLPGSYHKKAVERRHREQEDPLRWVENTPPTHPLPTKSYTVKNRSEERRVGKECPV